MLYFWLTSAVHIANRASMESVDQLALINKKKKKGKKRRKCPSTTSEPDLTAVVPPMTNRPRTNSQACISYASTSSLSEWRGWMMSLRESCDKKTKQRKKIIRPWFIAFCNLTSFLFRKLCQHAKLHNKGNGSNNRWSTF